MASVAGGTGLSRDGAPPRSAPRLVLFGTGSPLSLLALTGLAVRFPVVAVVVPDLARSRGLRGRARAAVYWYVRRRFLAETRALRVPIWRYSPHASARLADALGRAGTELGCVAAFPFRLPPSVLAALPGGALNVHLSLLPRHRGPAPLFWTYHDDDREAGVTVHWLDTGLDTGPIVLQEAIPLTRGRPLADLYQELAAGGTRLLADAVEAAVRGTAPAVAQDEAGAMHEPRPSPQTCRIDPAVWGAERLWHVLAGLGARYPWLLHDADGGELPHGPALGFTLAAHGRRPGSVQRAARGWRVYCPDGMVEVARATAAAWVMALARRLDHRLARGPEGRGAQ